MLYNVTNFKCKLKYLTYLNRLFKSQILEKFSETDASYFVGGRVNFCAIRKYSMLSLSVQGIFQVPAAYREKESKSLPLRSVTLQET